ncbi:hypothetical protein [Actinopolyspora mortivallis]|uniref:hypothetical protein n=1 Tax=Actinopolyspora mortivallis TaxID=33906 RepID=UPI000373EEE2|nr:hypothetical protein [Actinopolyspora mortivallis]
MTGTDEYTRDRSAARARLREFVRTHHPDVGGDPETFAAGIAALQRGRDEADGFSPTPPTTRETRAGDTVVIVRRDGLRGLLARLREWRSRRRRGPRVL